ncbi:hypothetical protein [Rhizobium phage RHph_X3_15]|nr:hypothetical protein [Rhizobium phage RHph_X3_15]
MGLFSSSKTTYVSSVAYNLAGDEDDRPNYLRALTTQHILSGSKETLGDRLNAGYLHGPGIQLRSFYNWAKDSGEYDEIGMPTGIIGSFAAVDSTLVGGQIPVTPPEFAIVQSASVGSADFTYWAEKYMLENHPNLINTDWVSDFIESTGKIKITFADTTTVQFTPSSPSYNVNHDYMYVSYVTAVENQEDAIIPGSQVDLGPTDPFPDTTGWTMISDTTTNHEVTLTESTRIVVTYSDGSPGSDDTTYVYTDTDYDERHAEYQQTTFNGAVYIGDAEVLSSTKSYMYFEQDSTVEEDVDVDVVHEDMGGGVTKTTTTIVTTEYLDETKWHRTDTQEITNKGWSSLKYFIYRIGSGNAVLDGLVPPDADMSGNFFPYIPIRLNNNFISETHLPDVYEDAKKGYKKAMKKSFDKLVESIEDNDDLEDIDYAYAVFGVSLNVKENACKKYLYHFFSNIMATQSSNNEDFLDWEGAWEEYDEAFAIWTDWRIAQHDDTFPYDPKKGDPEPPKPKKPTIPTNSVRIANTSSIDTKFDIRLVWNYIHEITGTGLGKTGAKKGEYWFEYLGENEYEQRVYSAAYNPQPDPIKIQKARLYWQETSTSWKALEIYGLKHRNYVYNGKSVAIDMGEALGDTDESGFIVPLHYQTFKDVSLVHGTQMSTACCFILFNCYQVVKQRWYEKGIFKILFVIVIAIVSVAFTGGAGLGLLGTNAAVGASLGFSGLTGAIVGSIANAMAALVLSTIIEKVTSSFGVLGSLIGSLFSIFTMNLISSFQAGFSFNWADLMRAENILKLTDAFSQGYSAFIQGNIQDLAAESQQIMNNYQKESERISKLYADNIGYANNIIDPTMFTNSSNMYLESGDTFLSRTLMTGSDIAAMSHDMLNSFTDLTLTLPTAYA